MSLTSGESVVPSGIILPLPVTSPLGQSMAFTYIITNPAITIALEYCRRLVSIHSSVDLKIRSTNNFCQQLILTFAKQHYHQHATMPKTPIVGVKYEDLQMYYQCRIIGCSTKCQANPKESGRLSVHWKKKHIDDHGSFNGREVLVKTRNEDGTCEYTLRIYY